MLIGIILGFAAGYLGGAVDAVIRTLSDTALTIPSLAILIVISAYVRQMDVNTMAFIVALFAWAGPTRLIRAQVLSMREQGYVRMARLSALITPDIMFREMMPNLLPYLAASFIGAASGGILAAVGLEALGLGPQRIPTLGMTISNAISGSAVLRGMWWWWGFPTRGPDADLHRPVPDRDRPGRGRQPAPARQQGARKHERESRPETCPTGSGTGPDGHGLNAVLDALRTTGAGGRRPPRPLRHAQGDVIAVNGVSFASPRRDRSVSWASRVPGKSTTAMAILRLTSPPGRIVERVRPRPRRGLLALVRARPADAALARHRADPAGIDELAQPGHAGARPDRRRHRGARGRRPARGH